MEVKYHFSRILIELGKAEEDLNSVEFNQLLNLIYNKVSQIAQSRNIMAQQNAFFEQYNKENAPTAPNTPKRPN